MSARMEMYWSFFCIIIQSGLKNITELTHLLIQLTKFFYIGGTFFPRIDFAVKKVVKNVIVHDLLPPFDKHRRRRPHSGQSRYPNAP